MGGVVSTNPAEVTSKRGMECNDNDKAQMEKLIQFLYPIYYTSQPLTQLEREKAIKCFKLISSNQATEFYRMKEKDAINVTCISPMEFFGNRFYKRLLEIHPTCQPLFGKSTMKQGKLLYNMMNFVVADLENPDPIKFRKTFEAIANSHNRIGVRAAEYAIFGEVLFWTLKLTVGKEEYDTSAHTAWVKIYSTILSHIIPIVVRYELQHQTVLQRSDQKRMQSFVTADVVTSEKTSFMGDSVDPSSVLKVASINNISTNDLSSVVPN